MSHSAGNHADFNLPGDLGEHDPRRMTHPIGNEPGAGGHEVKPNSKEAQGENLNDEPSAAHHDHDRHHPGKDNTTAQAFEGGSSETMDRAKRQAGSDSEGLSRAGHQQQSTMHGDHHEHGREHGHSSHIPGQGQGYDGTSSIRGPGQEGNFVRDQESRHQPTHGHHQNEGLGGVAGAAAGLTGSGVGHNTGRDTYQSGSEPLTGHHGSGSGLTGSGVGHNTGRDNYQSGTGSGLTGSGSGLTGRDNYQSGGEHLSGHHGSGLTGSGSGLTDSGVGHNTGSGLTGRDNYQSGSEPLSGHRGTGVGGEPYDAGNLQEPGVGGSAPQHSSAFGSHSTRAGELLDPSSGKETGIPGYAAGSGRQ